VLLVEPTCCRGRELDLAARVQANLELLNEEYAAKCAARRLLPATVREVQAHCAWLKEPGTAEAALEDLARCGVGTWILSPEGSMGRPTRRFRLAG